MEIYYLDYTAYFRKHFYSLPVPPSVSETFSLLLHSLSQSPCSITWKKQLKSSSLQTWTYSQYLCPKELSFCSTWSGSRLPKWPYKPWGSQMVVGKRMGTVLNQLQSLSNNLRSFLVALFKFLQVGNSLTSQCFIRIQG